MFELREPHNVAQGTPFELEDASTTPDFSHLVREQAFMFSTGIIICMYFTGQEVFGG